MDKASLQKISEKGLVECLCELSQSDALKRLVAFRRETVLNSLRAFRKAVTACGVSFGANAYSPIANEICGQDYMEAYAETCDFVQPLLCYMEWHRYEPLAAWGRYIRQHAKVDEPDAVEAAKNLFNLNGAICPDNFNEMDTCIEGGGESTYSIVSREIKMCAPYLPEPYKLQLVLRGKQWDWDVTDRLVDEARDLGFDSFIFTGCEYLLKDKSPAAAAPPLTGWS
jgi:hypothetical protein